MCYFIEPSGNNPKYPCGICTKIVSYRHKAIQCDLCNYWNHIKCDNVENKTYETLKKSQTLKALFNDFSSHNVDEPSPINCGYYDISSSIPYSNCNLSMLHLNLASLGLHKEELVTTLSLLDFDFDIIALSETRIMCGRDPIFDVSLTGYNHYLTPTESEKGGVIIYVKQNIDVKRRFDLEKKMYKSRELESVFLEIVNKGKKNEIFGCVYRHPSMSIDDFNKNIFCEFIAKLSSQNKIAYLCGDFNVDLLKIDTDENIKTFYSSLTSNVFVPYTSYKNYLTFTNPN